MPSANDFPARGRVTAIREGGVVFAPSNTNYELHLRTVRPYDGPVGPLMNAFVRATARKIYTVPSGGGFIAPLFGPPKTIQGRAVYLENGLVVIRAGCFIAVEIPSIDTGIDLSDGPISVGALVNAVALPGATFQFVGEPLRV